MTRCGRGDRVSANVVDGRGSCIAPERFGEGIYE